MLLFVRKQYSDAIRRGEKTYEIRAGHRYAGVKVGSQLSINGQFKVAVTRIDRHTRASLIAAMPALEKDIEACYPKDLGEYFIFHFDAPRAVA